MTTKSLDSQAQEYTVQNGDSGDEGEIYPISDYGWVRLKLGDTAAFLIVHQSGEFGQKGATISPVDDESGQIHFATKREADAFLRGVRYGQDHE